MSQFSTTIVFGQQATKLYANGEFCDEILNEWGSVEIFTFPTEAEQNAFLIGVKATCGWLDYAIKEGQPTDA